MASKNYNYQKPLDEKRVAKASRQNAKVSTKYSIEFSNYFKNMPLKKAIKISQDIEDKKDFLPLVRFNKKVGHRKGESKRGVSSGRFPIKCAALVKELLQDVLSNAEDKNLDTEKLKIIHMFASKGVTRSKLQPLGRVGGKQRESKSTNIEVIVLEE